MPLRLALLVMMALSCLSASMIEISGTGSGAQVYSWAVAYSGQPSIAGCADANSISATAQHFTVECAGPDITAYTPLWASAAETPLEVSLEGHAGRLVDDGEVMMLEYPRLHAWSDGIITSAVSGILSLDVVLEMYNGGISNDTRGSLSIGGTAIYMLPQVRLPQHVAIPVVAGVPTHYSMQISDYMMVEYGSVPSGRVRMSNLSIVENASVATAPEPQTWIMTAVAMMLIGWLRMRRQKKPAPRGKRWLNGMGS